MSQREELPVCNSMKSSKVTTLTPALRSRIHFLDADPGLLARLQSFARLALVMVVASSHLTLA
jgi:hypothetical protein